MSEIDLNEIFLKNDDEKESLDIDSPVNTTEDIKKIEDIQQIDEPQQIEKKRGRKKGTISEEQRQKMLDNLRRGRDKKKRELSKKKAEKLEADNETLKEIRELKAEIASLRSSSRDNNSQNVKVQDPKPQPVSQPVSKPVPSTQTKKEEEVVQLVKIQEVKPPEPKIVYHGFNPNKRRY